MQKLWGLWSHDTQQEVPHQVLRWDPDSAAHGPKQGEPGASETAASREPRAIEEDRATEGRESKVSHVKVIESHSGH